MVTIRKQGNVCTVFLDEAGRPVNFTNFDEPPEFAFPYVMDEAQAKASYPNVRFIEAAKPKEQTAPRLSEAELRSHMGQLGIPSDVTERLVKQGATAVVPVNVHEEVRMVVEASKAQELAIHELRILFAKHEACPQDKDIKATVEHVANFVLQIWPELLPNIEALKQSVNRPRFSL